MAKNDSIGARVIKITNALTANYYLILNTTDSVLLRSVKAETQTNSSVYEGMTIDKPLQLDGLGKEEIRLYYVLNDYDKAEDQKIAFIINPDTRQKMFEGKYYYVNSEKRTGFLYDISFDATGNLLVKHNKYNCAMEPEQKEGIYSLKNGKYTWTRSMYSYSSKTIAQNDSIGVKVVRISRCENPLSRYYLFFNNGSDSIEFYSNYSCIETTPFGHRENCRVSARQLDNKGREEIIVEYSSEDSDRGGKSTHIFNLDSKQRIFCGQNTFYSFMVGEQVAQCKGYSYKITYDKDGRINITYPDKEPCMTPDQKEGIYTIENGRYIRVEKK